VQFIEINKRKIGDAYERWIKQPGYRLNKPGGVSDIQWFNRNIDNVSRMLGYASMDKTKLPRNRQTLSDWRNNNNRIKLPEVTCKSIFIVTNVDVTPKKIFESQENFTDVAFIRGPLNFQKISNSKGDDGHGTFVCKVDGLAFRPSASIEVTSAWLKDSRKEQSSEDAHRIGTLEWGIFRATAELTCNSEIYPLKTTFKSQFDPIRMDDDPGKPGRWTISGEPGNMLRGDILIGHLANVVAKDGEKINMEIFVDEIDVHCVFVKDDNQPPDSDEKTQARNSLIGKILRDASRPNTNTKQLLLCRKTKNCHDQ